MSNTKAILRSALLFDKSVEDVDILLGGVTSGTKCIAVDGSSFLTEFNSVLANNSINIIHILTHGTPGSLRFEDRELGEAEILSYFSFMESASFENRDVFKQENFYNLNNKEINFWSCNVGQGDKGMKFVNDLANLTGAKVSASSTTIGHQDKGGNWELDVMAYPQVPFNKTAIENFEHTLSTGSDKPVFVLDPEAAGTSYSEVTASSSGPLFIAHHPEVYLTSHDAYLKSSTVTIKTAAATDKLVLPATSGGQIQATLIDANGTPATTNNTVMNSTTTSPVYFKIESNEGGNTVITNVRVTLSGGDGSDFVATFEGWDPTASGGPAVSSGSATSSQFYTDLINSVELDGIADEQTREVSISVTDINNATSDPSIATVERDTSFVESSITGYSPMINGSGEWIAETQSGVVSGSVGFGVNIDDTANVQTDITTALEAAGIITDSDIANGSFSGDLTPTNMADLLTELGASSALGKLISAPNYSISDSSSVITFSNMVIAGGSATASPNEIGSGYTYELDVVMLSANVNSAPSLLTSNSPSFTVSYTGGSSDETISLESYRVNNGDNLFSDLNDQLHQ